MTVFQCHLEINQRLQEVASFKRDKLFPQEIDLALNKAMFRLLERGVENNFQGDEINLSHVAALITKNKIGEVIIPGTSDPLYEENELSVYSIVPANYYWLVNGRAEIITDPLECETAPILATKTITEYVTVVPFPASAGTGVPTYFSKVTINSTTGGVIYTTPSEITGFNSQNSKYVITDNIVEYFYKNPTTVVYWERYRDVYNKNSFIFVSLTNPGTTTLTLYRSDAITVDVTSSATATATNYTAYNRAAIASIASKTIANTPIKSLKQNEMYAALKQNRYYRTSTREVSLNRTQDYFILYREESFLVTRMSYDYIRKPRTISLLLNQSCELADNTHPKVVDLAVELLRLDTKDQAYQATVQDTELRTN